MIQVHFKRLRKDAQMPFRGSEHAMCYDLYCVHDEDFYATGGVAIEKPFIVLLPGASHVFHTGIATAIQEGYGALLWDRSGMGVKRNIHRLAGVIDSDYRGEWMVSLINLSQREQVIYAGDRIVQVQFAEQISADWEEFDILPDSIRGAEGFGSTGA